MLTQAEAGNPAAGERYANTPTDQMMLSLPLCCCFFLSVFSLIAVIVVKNIRGIERVFHCIRRCYLVDERA